MDEKAPKIDDKKFAAHMNKNKKPKTQTSTQKSLAHIRKRADSIVKSRKTTASMRNSAGLRGLGDAKVEENVIKKVANKLAKKVQKKTRDPNVVRRLAHKAATAAVNATEQDMSGMCCKNCGDMFGKPTKENKSCMYNAYNPKGKNWINAQKVITPKMQKRALASPAAKAKPKSQVSLGGGKPPFKIPPKQNESFNFKVNIDGFPEMFMSGNSPSEVKANLRKLVKQPSMIQSVDRVTTHDKRKHHRDKMKESLDEDPCWDTHKQVGMKKKGNKMVPNCVPKNEDNVDELSMSRKDITKSGIGKTGVDKDKIKKDLEKLRKGLKRTESVKEGIKYTHAAIDKSGKVIGMASQESDAKDMARRNKGRVVKLKKPMSDKKGDMMINRQFKEGGMKRKSTGDGMDTFKKKPPENESYAPDEGTPAARKKASKMTPGQEGVMDFLKNVGNTVMYGTQKSKPTQSQPRSRINTNRNSTSGGANSIASRINFGGKYGNK
tara:strand:- start:134 stop:1612 length:1479 start_codon:yes stop_codon:yes gene_type:complete